MRTISVDVASNGGYKAICLGYRGENEATEVVFDISSLIETYGAGVVVLLAKRATDTAPYPVSVELADNTVIWTLSAQDTYIQGYGMIQLMYYVGETLAKSFVYSTYVAEDIAEAGEEPPDAFETWIEQLTELGAVTLQNAQDAQQAATDAQTAQTGAEAAKTSAETAQSEAEAAKVSAEEAQNNSEYSSLKSEGYAVGTQNEVPVEYGSPYYKNNSKYYSEVAQQSASEGGYIQFDIDNNGHLIYTKTSYVDLDFSLNNGHLILEVA